MNNLRGLTDSEGSDTETTHQKNDGSNQYSSVQASTGQQRNSPPVVMSDQQQQEQDRKQAFESKQDS